MRIQPIVKNGRFYNHEKESTKHRLKEIITTFFYITSKRIRKNIFSFDSKNVAQNWIVKTKPIPASIKPIITWLGHSTFLIQIAGKNIITDPVFYGVSKFYPRMVSFPFPPTVLPKIDIILISHNHMDHMNKRSLLELKKNNPFILVPEGDKAWFTFHKFKNTIEHKWWEETSLPVNENIRSKQVLCSFLPAFHWSGRTLHEINTSLWGSWLIEYDGFRIYFGGDTAFSSHFKAIGTYYNPIDIALLPIGPHNPRDRMQDSHISSTEVIQAFVDLQARHLFPMHWGTFRGGLDNFENPIEELKNSWEERLEVANSNNKHLYILKFGEGHTF
jgi:L-ascorbate metabolism protein UlaG (beta-lactamase superfamily)